MARSDVVNDVIDDDMTSMGAGRQTSTYHEQYDDDDDRLSDHSSAIRRPTDVMESMELDSGRGTSFEDSVRNSSYRASFATDVDVATMY